MDNSSTLLLLDLDETLTCSLQPITDDMKQCLERCREKGYRIAVVSGSDIKKVKRQLTAEFVNSLEYTFCENGTQVYKSGSLVHSESIVGFLSDSFLNELFNFTLRYLSELDIPKKRGCFIERRKSVINFSPIGRNCTNEERLEFYDLDCKLKIREKMRDVLSERFKDYEPKINFSLGGKISIDCFPEGWNKCYCLKFLDSFETIHFFGDMTFPGGNDYELFINPRVIGHSVANYQDTIRQLNELFLTTD